MDPTWGWGAGPPTPDPSHHPGFIRGSAPQTHLDGKVAKPTKLTKPTKPAKPTKPTEPTNFSAHCFRYDFVTTIKCAPIDVLAHEWYDFREMLWHTQLVRTPHTFP